MSKKTRKGKVLAFISDFPAWIIWLQKDGEPPYYRVQPFDFQGKILSHSVLPDGYAHARLWKGNKYDESTSVIVPPSAIRYFDVEAGKPAFLPCPDTTATVSFASPEFHAFEFKAVKASGGLEISSPGRLRLSAVCWETAASFYRPILEE